MIKKNIFDNKFLLIISFALILKVIIAGLFSSDYQDLIFIPFVEYFINNFQNPWEYFYRSDQSVAFPYPPLMLYILSPFKYLISILNTQNIFVQNLLFKIPSIIFDVWIFLCLLKIFPQKKYLVFIIYFLSPIILFATYINSQLDLIPIAFLFFSYYLITKNKFYLSAICMSLALLCKSNVFIAFPLVIIYLYKNYKFKNLFVYCFLVLVFYLFFSAPFILTEEYQFFVFNNPEQNLIFNTFQIISNKNLLWVVAAIILLYGRFFYYSKVNKQLLLDFINIAFIIVLTLTYPIPSWYIWIVPFVSIYFLSLDDDDHDKALTLFYFFNFFYLFYSVFIYDHPLQSNLNDIIYLNNAINLKLIVTNDIDNILFTILNTIIFIFALIIYKRSVLKNQVYNTKKVFTFGVAGDSGSGKSFLCSDLQNLIGTKDFLLLEGDGEHKWERSDKNWKKLTHLNPVANKLHNQFDMLRVLAMGKAIIKRNYNHVSGKFTEPFLVKPKKFIVLDSLHPFYLPKARKNIDIKIYMNPEESIRRKWKIFRDEKLRKHKKQFIVSEIKRREVDKKKYILPQIKHADIIFNYSYKPKGNKKITDLNLQLNIILEADVRLDEILESFNSVKTIKFNHDYTNDLSKQELVLQGTISKRDIERIASRHIADLSELISNKPLWKENYRGIKQLFILLMIDNKLKD
tara:strand:- start:151 stop:2211 length:2061 start_codon:yes stop_codon:yes gene_type:complete